MFMVQLTKIQVRFLIHKAAWYDLKHMRENMVVDLAKPLFNAAKTLAILLEK